MFFLFSSSNVFVCNCVHVTIHSAKNMKTRSVRGIEVDVTRLILLWIIMVYAMHFYETLNTFLQEDSWIEAEGDPSGTNDRLECELWLRYQLRVPNGWNYLRQGAYFIFSPNTVLIYFTAEYSKVTSELARFSLHSSPCEFKAHKYTHFRATPFDYVLTWSHLLDNLHHLPLHLWKF